MRPGDKFGRLEAVRYLRSRWRGRAISDLWEFKCECGKKVIRSTYSVIYSVKEGNSPLCSPKCTSKSPFYKALNEGFNGRVFGELTAVEATGRKSSRVQDLWLFRCTCGKIVEKAASQVFNDHKKGIHITCGSKQCKNLHRLGTDRATVCGIMAQYRTGAKKRNFDFILTEVVVKALINGVCFYCGSPPANMYRYREIPDVIRKYSGIDRVDSSKGYIPGNVVSCCQQCNIAKNKLSISEFDEWVKRVFTRMGTREIVSDERMVSPNEDTF